MAPIFAASASKRLIDALRQHTRQIILIAALVFVAALLGSLSRPTGFLAAFWPANAVLVGILLRNVLLSRISILLAAAAGYMAAAIAVGDQLGLAWLMTLANIIGAATVAVMLRTGSDQDRSLSRPQGVVVLLVASIAGSASGAVPGGAAMAGLVSGGYFDGWSAWFAAELVNYLALIPVVLTWPAAGIQIGRPGAQVAPIAALVVAVALSLIVPHSVAIVFPVPALIWCALSLPMVATSILVMLYAGLAMLGLKLGFFAYGVSGASTMAVHLGIALVALGPVMVASANVERRRQMDRLLRLAQHDELTDALTRGAFTEKSRLLREALVAEQAPVAVLLVDADHFKQINDTHGHAGGDRVLVAVAAAIKASIRQGDLFGRIGGEEFALVLPRISLREAAAVAERIRHTVENLAVVLDSDDVQSVTVSVGLAFSATGAPPITEMISLADRAMYDAKRAGRNRVEVYQVPPREMQGY
ncbi:sensor domain-containing diguanylate cyclase [Devosia ginsengisoli]|uniref:GGDEF domain-containing protein n=1 Tax=Devosia ginsengisoli TaxID=400770 RepID=UPI0026E91FC4|nr:sensor domain-containing diguanylate cyclase [Devosia ginsengisoli]MCR6673713.1 diguanylate cyclase [Devosia ginsengisoli]